MSQGTKDQVRRFLERAVAESNLMFNSDNKIVVKSMMGNEKQKVLNDRKKRVNRLRRRFGI